MRQMYYYDSYCCLLLVNKLLSKESFCRKAGAVSGYAKFFFSRVYDSIFAESEDAVAMYEKYYRPEYSSLEDYLRNKYSLPLKDVSELLKALDMNTNLTVIDIDELRYGDEPAYSFWTSDFVIERVLAMLI